MMTPPTLAEVHAAHLRLHYRAPSCVRCRAMPPEPERIQPAPPKDPRPIWLQRGQFNRDLTGRVA